MPLFAYNRDIPAATNNPSADQPLMQTNYNNIDSLIDEDHYSFDESDGGLHRQVRMPVLGAIPAGLANGDGALYTKASTGSQLFYSPDNSGNEYQLTRTRSANFATFSTNTVYSGTIVGGWTFLPGGMVMIYGLATSSGVALPNTTVALPFTLTDTIYSVNCTILTTADSRFFVEVYDVANNQFRAVTRDSGGNKTSGLTFYWQVIGK